MGGEDHRERTRDYDTPDEGKEPKLGLRFFSVKRREKLERDFVQARKKFVAERLAGGDRAAKSWYGQMSPLPRSCKVGSVATTH